MPLILQSFLKCKPENKYGNAWEITWKKPFEAIGGEVYRQMYDGKPERII